jgi:1,4-dihydroxy-2-naphthoyl-CoA hydrolase
LTIWHGGKFPFEAMNAFPTTTLVGTLGIEIIDAGDDWVKGKMPVDQRTRQYAGILHGGASVALAETLASVGCYCTLDTTTHGCAGMEINANHIRPVSEGFVYGVAKQEAAGRSTQVWTIRITDERDKLVCISRCTMAVIASAGR